MVKLPKKTLILLKLILVAAVSGQVLMSGCLTPEQQVVVKKLENRKGKILEAVQAIEGEIILVKTAILNKEYTLEAGKKIITGLMERRATLLESVTGLDDDLAEARAAGVPWWGYIPTILGLIAGTASTVMGVRGTGKANAVSFATGASFGALSRGLDVGITRIDSAAAAFIKDAIRTAAKETPGTSPDALRALHHKSIASENPVAV